MFTRLRSFISAAAVVELHSSRIRVRDISTRTMFEFEPILSIDGSQRVVAVGRPIPATAVKTYAPFASPLALSEEPRIAQLILAFAYSRLGSVPWLKPAPRIVLFIGGDYANGVQRMNDKTLVELSTSAGARTTVIHRGGPVSDVEAIGMLDAA
jgi:acetyl esterase/lipase